MSKDTGFDPIIQHLNNNKLFRCDKVVVDLHPYDVKQPIDFIIENLMPLTERPEKIRSLKNYIAHLLHPGYSKKEIEHILYSLEDRGCIKVKKEYVSYSI